MPQISPSRYMVNAGWDDVPHLDEQTKRELQCKQCHDRHYEEWKGMREQTMDLKTFGRVDGALLHGTALTSPVFQTVLGLWLQTKPDADQRNRCLSCHVPSVTVFPQHTDRIIAQVMKGKKHVKVEGGPIPSEKPYQCWGRLI